MLVLKFVFKLRHKQIFLVVAWRGADEFFKHLAELGIIGITCTQGNFFAGNIFVALQKFFSLVEAETHKVIAEGDADFIFETPAQIGARNVGGFGKFVQADFFAVMLRNIRKHEFNRKFCRHGGNVISGFTAALENFNGVENCPLNRNSVKG